MHQAPSKPVLQLLARSLAHSFTDSFAEGDVDRTWNHHHRISQGSWGKVTGLVADPGSLFHSYLFNDSFKKHFPNYPATEKLNYICTVYLSACCRLWRHHNHCDNLSAFLFFLFLFFFCLPSNQILLSIGWCHVGEGRHKTKQGLSLDEKEGGGNRCFRRSSRREGRGNMEAK